MCIYPVSHTMASFLEELTKTFLDEDNKSQTTLGELLKELGKEENINEVFEQIKNSPIMKMGIIADEKKKPNTTSAKSPHSASFSPAQKQFPNNSLPCPIDIREMETFFMVYCEMPGVISQSVNLDAEDGYIMLCAEKHGYSIGSDQFLCKERAFGVYKKEIKLPETANLAMATATYDNGVLAIKVPKVNRCTKKKIHVTFSA